MKCGELCCEWFMKCKDHLGEDNDECESYGAIYCLLRNENKRSCCSCVLMCW